MRTLQFTNKRVQGLHKGNAMQAITEIKRTGWLQQMADKAQTGIVIPNGFIVGFLLFIIAQTLAGIWWAAKLDTTMNYSIQQIDAQKTASETRMKALEEKAAVHEITLQLLQVKLGIIEGKKK